MLVSWGARALYVGRLRPLTAPQRVAVSRWAWTGRSRSRRRARSGTVFHRCRTALIEPNQLHSCGYRRGLRFPICRCAEPRSCLAAKSVPAARATVSMDSTVRTTWCPARRMRRSDEGWRSASPSLSAALGFERPTVDWRIAQLSTASSALLRWRRILLRLLRALAFCLSLPALFKATTGITVRRFRLWARMRHALAMAVAGATITHAALEAGFSSPAHFSAAFSEMFGMAPTQLLPAHHLRRRRLERVMGIEPT